MLGLDGLLANEANGQYSRRHEGLEQEEFGTLNQCLIRANRSSGSYYRMV